MVLFHVENSTNQDKVARYNKTKYYQKIVAMMTIASA